jgi:hypothetical protein
MIIIQMDKKRGYWTAVMDEEIILKREEFLIDLTDWVERRYADVPCYVNGWF